MKLFLETIAENLAVPTPSHIVVQYWGSNKGKSHLEYFIQALNQKHPEVTGILFDKDAMIRDCELGPYSITNQISDETLQKATVIVDLCTFSPTSLVQYMTATSRPNFVGFMRNHFAAITGPDKMMIQIRIPSSENAMEAGLELEAYTNIYKEMVMVDYSKMNVDCDMLIQNYSGVHDILIETDGGHALHLSIENRDWLKDAGEGDFPAGEVYIAPIETSANGTYKVDFIHWEGEHFKDVVLTFEAGRLVASSESRIVEDLKMADENATVIAELGLGVNPNIRTLTGHSLFDEKMSGSCHIAVGMNHLFGGANMSVAHVDFVAQNPKISIITK